MASRSSKKRKNDERPEADAQPTPGRGAIALGVMKSWLPHNRRGLAELLIGAALMAYGIYLAAVFWGHLVVPNGDFKPFFRTGTEILSFELPSAWKRVPLLGILQNIMSWIVGGEHPALTGGWMLNAILLPLNLVLLWRVGKRLVGPLAVWVALLAIINSWTIRQYIDPVAETTLLFFILLSYLLAFRGTRWAYLAAMAASMVRYEGAAMLLVCFVLDVMRQKTWRSRFVSLGLAALAALPMLLWMLGTYIDRMALAEEHYFNVFSDDYKSWFTPADGKRTGLVLQARLVWNVAFKPYVMIPLSWGVDAMETLRAISRIAAASLVSLGLVVAAVRRNKYVLALLILAVPYFILHAFYPYPLERYQATVFWIPMLLSLYGLRQLWLAAERHWGIPLLAKVILGGLLAVAAGAMAWTLWPSIPEQAEKCPPAATVPLVTCLAALLVAAIRTVVRKGHWRHGGAGAVALAVVVLAVFSNQFYLCHVVGHGRHNEEFRELARWIRKNTEPGQKIALYGKSMLWPYIPDRNKDLEYPPVTDDPPSFARACVEEELDYIAWATREGLRMGGGRYRRMNLLENMAPLRWPRDAGPFEFVTRLAGQDGYINVFRVVGDDPSPPSSEQ